MTKTNSGTFKTAVFNLCDANFANRDNGADFRISDNIDGAEYISEVRAIGLPSGPASINVSDFGANPYDNNPDSDAIQKALDYTCSGDTVVFSTRTGSGYMGYKIDKTLFLTGMSAKHDLTFTSSSTVSHALLIATAELKGYVVRLYSRSRLYSADDNPGSIDTIDFGNIDVEGNRDERVCCGSDRADGVPNGISDNWGSWLPGECNDAGDPWCNPGNIAMVGQMDFNNPAQNFTGNPSRWTTGIIVHDIVDSGAECGSALTFGGAAGTIRNVTIDAAGDHVHGTGCTLTDADGDNFGWSDGITLMGTAQTVTNTTIINPSDVGIVYFGGKDTVIANNTVSVTAGNNGAFAGIALHPWQFGDVSGVQFTGNRVTRAGDARCGGIHAGINLGPHMWGGACVNNATGAVFGTSLPCAEEPLAADVAGCTLANCQLWAYVPLGETLPLRDNTVTGSNINFLIDGLDILGQFIDENNVSQTPHTSDWQAASVGCGGAPWGTLDKVAHHPSLVGYTNLRIHCER